MVVARAHVAGGVALTSESPAQVRVRRGQALLLKFAYRAEEATKGREAWRFVLTSSSRDHRPPPAEANLRDRRGLGDDVGGFLTQEYKFAGPGAFEVQWEAFAQLSVGAWSGDAQPKRHEETLKGRLRVHVE